MMSLGVEKEISGIYIPTDSRDLLRANDWLRVASQGEGVGEEKKQWAEMAAGGASAKEEPRLVFRTFSRS